MALLTVNAISLAVPALTEELTQINYEAEIIAVVGAPGEEKFIQPFSDALNQLEIAAKNSPAIFHEIGNKKGNAPPPKKELLQKLSKLNVSSEIPVWLIFIGHGTFDGIDAKFNLHGPDLESKELVSALEGFKRDLIIVLGFSSSAPFLPALSGPGRTIVTSTRSGYESNYSRFVSYFCRALNDTKADFDKDNQVSLLESFLYASKSTSNFYDENNRLVSEHALIDDTGDKKGTPADWFTGLLPQKSPKNAIDIDGFKAHQIILVPDEFERSLPFTIRKKRNQLESDLKDLRNKKSSLSKKEYQSQLEVILTGLASLYFPDTGSNKQPISESGER